MHAYPYAHLDVQKLDFTFEQIGDDLNTLQFVARPEGDPLTAFTFETVRHLLLMDAYINTRSLSSFVQKHTIPNLTVRLAREPEWRNLYPELKGPDVCLISFGPNCSMGRFGYGIIAEQSMAEFLRRPNSSSTSIYFTAQNKREYKWKQSNWIIECIDTHSKKCVAQYDTGYSPPQMRISGDGVLICTELFVTWFLHQYAKTWKWVINIEKDRGKS